LTTVQISSWVELARCRGAEDDLFPEGKQQKRAAAVCVGCPVRANCLAEALDHRIEWGIWGGMTERERRALLRQRPDVKNWHEVLVEMPMHQAAAS
jgi:WhiB family transcriptional regulator, redox-sensing transcriptional regulator